MQGAGDAESLYGGYGGYGGGYSGYSPPTALPSPPMSAPPPQQQQQQQQQQQMTNMAKKTPLLSSMMTERGNGPPQQGMMGSPMGHMPQPHMPPQVNQGSYMQQASSEKDIFIKDLSQCELFHVFFLKLVLKIWPIL